jgi:hypothetical protein
VDDVDVGIGVEDLDRAPNGGGIVGVVRVQPTQHIAAGRPPSLVDRVRLPAVGLGDPADARPAGLQDIEAVVGRPAIDHEVLDRGVVLREHGLDRLVEIAPLVQRWRHHADQRRVSCDRRDSHGPGPMGL